MLHAMAGVNMGYQPPEEVRSWFTALKEEFHSIWPIHAQLAVGRCFVTLLSCCRSTTIVLRRKQSHRLCRSMVHRTRSQFGRSLPECRLIFSEIRREFVRKLNLQIRSGYDRDQGTGAQHHTTLHRRVRFPQLKKPSKAEVRPMHASNNTQYFTLTKLASCRNLVAMGNCSGGLAEKGWASYGVGWYLRDPDMNSQNYVPDGMSSQPWPGGFQNASKLRFYEGRQVDRL